MRSVLIGFEYPIKDTPLFYPAFEVYSSITPCRVLIFTAVMDDTEARGFLFSYEKLFGATPKSDTDIKNEQEGKDTGIIRTTRLFYVACTRAQKSLAVLAYTENAEAVKSTAISNGWFMEDEVRIV